MRAWLVTLILILTAAAPAATALPGLTADASQLDPAGLQAPGADASWARQAVAELPRATAVNDADGDKLFDDLEQRFLQHAGQGLPTVVSFTHGTSTAEGLEAVRAQLPGHQPTRTFTLIPAIATELTLPEATRLASLTEVRQIEWDRPGTLELDTATAVMGADTVAGELAITGDRDGNETRYTPEDVVIAVLDTGFHDDHADLDDGKLLRFVDLGNGQEEAYDPNGHGTHVASIAAGTGDGDPAYRGVAPGAGLVGIKIVDDSGQRSSLSLAIEGYEYVVEHKDELGIDVTTISFGFGTATDGTTALERAIDEVWEAGIVNFKSTGNGGPERRTITVPAAARGILATGAMLDPDGASGSGATGTPADDRLSRSFGFQLATFSSRGPTTDGRIKPDIAAPGVSITAAEAGTEDGYLSLSGTSMASPFAAGTAALVLDANPALTPDELRQVLTGTAEDWGLGGQDVDYGWGRLQVVNATAAAALRAGTSLAGTTPIVPYHEVRTGVLASAIDSDPATLLGTETITVEDTEMPLAVTAILEGRLVEILVEAPGGDIVASLEPLNPVARQHVVGFQPTEPGEHTIRLVGEPMAPYVIDVAHGTAGGLEIGLPEGPLETASTPDGQDEAGVPLAPWLALAALVLAGLIAAGRPGRFS